MFLLRKKFNLLVVCVCAPHSVHYAHSTSRNGFRTRLIDVCCFVKQNVNSANDSCLTLLLNWLLWFAFNVICIHSTHTHIAVYDIVLRTKTRLFVLFADVCDVRVGLKAMERYDSAKSNYALFFRVETINPAKTTC